MKDNKAPLIEHKLFEGGVLLCIVVVTTWLVLGLIFKYNTASMLANGAVLAVNCLTFFALKSKLRFSVTSTAYFAIIILLLVYAWLPSGGFQGIVPMMMTLIYILALLILPSRTSLIIGGVMLLVVLAYAILEIQNPSLAPAYATVKRRIIDIAIASMLTLLIGGLYIYLFRRTQRKDRRKIVAFNEELAEEKVKAESADKAKSQFLAMISHEMRTPLNGIVGISNILKETDLDENQGMLLDKLVVSSNLLYSLISDVLDLSQIEEGKLSLQPTSFDLEKEMNAVLAIFTTKVEEKGISLIYEHDPKIKKQVTGDLSRLNQVIVNLVNNAIKFTEKGGVTVKTLLLDYSASSHSIRFEVTDTGIGIPDQEQTKLFQKFQRVETPNHQKYEGTGLGLAISKNLVEAMGGQIQISSKHLLGSSFSFDLMFEIKNADGYEAIERPKPISLDTNALKILLAEDNEINRMVATKMLNKMGIVDIDIAVNGLEALERCRNKDYDLVLMDLQMPEMGGIESSEMILDLYKTEKKDLAKPVIFALTANVFTDDIEKCKKAGMSHFISKPFTPESLKKAIGDYVLT